MSGRGTSRGHGSRGYKIRGRGSALRRSPINNGNQIADSEGSQLVSSRLRALREMRKNAEPACADTSSNPTFLRPALLDTLPTEIVHKILDHIPQIYRVKILLCMTRCTHFAACVRSHSIHGQGLEVLDDADFPILADLLRIERELWSFASDVKKKLSTQELPAINGRIFVYFLRHFSGIPLISRSFHIRFDELGYPRDYRIWTGKAIAHWTQMAISEFWNYCYTEDEFVDHAHLPVKGEWSPNRHHQGLSVHSSSAMCPKFDNLLDTCPLGHRDYSDSLEADKICLNERRRGHSIVAISRAIYKAGCDLRAAQLYRLADLLDSHPYVLRSSFDPERTIRVNCAHLQQNVRRRAKKCEGYQVRESDQPPVRLKSIGPYLRGPVLPLVPLDHCLNLLVQSVALELAAQPDRQDFSTGDDLAEWLQAMWAEKLANQQDQQLARTKAAQELYERTLLEPHLRKVGLKEFKQLGEDIQTFLTGLANIYDYKSTSIWPRIEVVPSSACAKGKKVESHAKYELACQRYEAATAWPTDLTVSPCSFGFHTPQRKPFLKTVQKKWQFIDYRSINSTKVVTVDHLNAPLDERELSWLEAFLRLTKVFHEAWNWRKEHEGECSIPRPQPLMTRSMGIRRAAWVEGLERGREIENPLLAAEKIMNKSRRLVDLPGKRPFHV